MSVSALPDIPETRPGDDLAALAVDALARAGLDVAAGDVFVFTQKVVSKAEGRLVALDEVEPSPEARSWAEAWGRDARVIELVLREASRVVRMERGVLITETRTGLVCANSGVDTSNVPPGCAALLPLDPDASARGLCATLRARLGTAVGVVISDTFGRPWREGQTDVAIGAAGLRPILDHRGTSDRHGRTLRATRIAIADELAAAADLVLGKTGGNPVALVQGVPFGTADLDGPGARALVRAAEEDLFR